MYYCSGSNEEHDKSKLDALLQYLMDNELITDGTVAQDHTQYAVRTSFLY